MSDKLVIFGASLRRQAWGCLLAENSPRKYILQFHEQLHERIEPLDSVVASLGLPIEQEDVEVFALDMTVAQIDGTEIVFLVRGATKLQLQSRKSTDDDSSASDAEASGSPKKDSDLSSFQCDDNSSRGEADLESQSVFFLLYAAWVRSRAERPSVSYTKVVMEVAWTGHNLQFTKTN